VDDQPFTVKAVGYAPTPVGIDPTVTEPYGDYFTSEYASFWKRDLPLIRALGANTVKLWGWNNINNHKDFLDALLADKDHPLFVIPTFFIGPSVYPNLADPNTKAKAISDFDLFLNNIANHPAVLFYNLGSDLNADWNYGFEKDAVFDLLNTLAVRVKVVEIANPRPVSTAVNDANSIPTIKQYDGNTKLDLWSLNIYRGCSFGSLFRDYSAASARPLFISEFGIDAYDDLRQALGEQQQADCYDQQWHEIETNSSIVIGGAIVEYVDEFWKAKNAQVDARHIGCPNYNPLVQMNCGYQNDNFPDRYANSAYFGIVDVNQRPRIAYSLLQKAWNGTNN
jgi:hypothetical protein